MHAGAGVDAAPMPRKRRTPPREAHPRRVPAPSDKNPLGGHMKLGVVVGDPAVEVVVVIFDDALDLHFPGVPPILLDERDSIALEKVIRQARRNMPPPAPSGEAKL